ncbi:butyrophilin-like protein 2 [Erpetoichthys calabaricus]|uniref:butyrophilin-like protein 2 n=1 Tax=Erpetoichthys calabaricus TaxID=27687 RepID=UPI00223440F5|nr:butyrophilin-like protein 2 [Erpetoichthys calabaricus]
MAPATLSYTLYVATTPKFPVIVIFSLSLVKLVYALVKPSGVPIALCHCNFSVNLIQEEEARHLPETVLLYPEQSVQMEHYFEGRSYLMDEPIEHVKDVSDGLPRENHFTINLTDVHVTVNHTVVAELFQDVVLPCAFTGSVDLLTAVIYWIRIDSLKNITILAFENGTRQHGKEDSAYQSRTKPMFDITVGDASLFLNNVTLADRGSYMCQVGDVRKINYSEGCINLTVTASSKSLYVESGWNDYLTIISHSWFPAPVVEWVGNKGEDVTNKSVTDVLPEKDGLLSIVSRYHVGNVFEMDFKINFHNPVSGTTISVHYNHSDLSSDRDCPQVHT